MNTNFYLNPFFHAISSYSCHDKVANLHVTFVMKPLLNKTMILAAKISFHDPCFQAQNYLKEDKFDYRNHPKKSSIGSLKTEEGCSNLLCIGFEETI